MNGMKVLRSKSLQLSETVTKIMTLHNFRVGEFFFSP